MSTEQNQAFVRRFYEALDNRKCNAAYALLAPVYVVHISNQPTNLEDYKQAITML